MSNEANHSLFVINHLFFILKLTEVSVNVIDSKEGLMASVSEASSKVDDILVQVSTESILLESTMEIGTMRIFFGSFYSFANKCLNFCFAFRSLGSRAP